MTISNPQIHDPRATADDVSRDTRRADFEFNKLAKRLRRQVGQAVVDYGMIDDGDLVMVCLSGGKDSYTMLDMLMSLQRNAPIRFELLAVNLDQKQPGFPAEVLPEYLRALGVRHEILEEDTYSIVKASTPEGKITCPICSRLRRGILYSHAVRRGANKIALGHHMDDVVATLFLNLFHGGRLKAMPPKLKSDDGRNIVIRPLFHCREADIERYSQARRHPIIPCNLCGSQENLQRRKVGEMLRSWDREQPGRVENIARALANVSPSHLADTTLFDFAGLSQDNLLAIRQVE
ncbi:MAG: tRNA 2-thiocytidine(32) synthetase TtcA [Pseudomonadales bacterium]|nr:tRNA 2-thiocytidine(32) synthetase TtcA [Pseudomonadales bacterium]MCP5183136.1 tRNA 2-thiocytidine(32) synthetase TtcA [Pseudomonadales bacterium]